MNSEVVKAFQLKRKTFLSKENIDKQKRKTLKI